MIAIFSPATNTFNNWLKTITTLKAMSIKIRQIHSAHFHEWDRYVLNHPNSNLYHLSGWQNVIEKTYGLKTYYLMAIKSDLRAMSQQLPANEIVGVFPLVHLKHFLFGNSLISMPFFDMGGILADNEDAEKALLSESMKLARRLKAGHIELRHDKALPWIDRVNPTNSTNSLTIAMNSHKVRMLLDLPESSEELMKSFKSKLRSQIRKPLKEGLKSKVGGLELLDDFYDVFSTNMRDLGSPVHPKRLIKNVIQEFPKSCRIITVCNESHTMAGSVIVGFKKTLENPWASALREFSRLSPNMLLYWSMLEYACSQGFGVFDFGRSSPAQGSYKFKEQWGAKPTQLHWHFIVLNGGVVDEELDQKSRFEKAIRYWQKLPVPLTRIIGPMIRKHIGL